MTLGISMLENIVLLHAKMQTHETCTGMLNNIFALHTKNTEISSQVPQWTMLNIII